MSPPELGWDEEERALLESAALDAPAPGAQKRLLATLGVSGAALGVVTTVGTANASAAGAKAFGFGKLLAALLIGGSVGGAALHYRAQFSAAPAATRVTPARPRVLTTPELPPPPVSTDASTAAETLPDKVKATTAAAAARREPDLALEIESLDRARRAADSGDFPSALRELDAYDRGFKRGRLRPEALVLRVQTLVRKGDAASAKALGGRFLARYPESPIAPRIRKLIGGSK